MHATLPALVANGNDRFLPLSCLFGLLCLSSKSIRQGSFLNDLPQPPESTQDQDPQRQDLTAHLL
jgi:hypothetical protein